MNLITLAQARLHVKADGDDDDVLTIYCNAAEAACARLANRNLYKDMAALNAALSALPDALSDAWEAHDAAMIAAAGLSDLRQRAFAEDNARASLSAAMATHQNVVNGIVVTDDMIAAVLLTVGHLYRNRENNITGQGAAAVELPMSAQNLMAPHRWIGPL